MKSGAQALPTHTISKLDFEQALCIFLIILIF